MPLMLLFRLSRSAANLNATLCEVKEEIFTCFSDRGYHSLVGLHNYKPPPLFRRPRPRCILLAVYLSMCDIQEALQSVPIAAEKSFWQQVVPVCPHVAFEYHGVLGRSGESVLGEGVKLHSLQCFSS